MNSSYSEGLITPGSPLTSYRPKISPSNTPGPACVCVAFRNSLEESKSDNFVLMIFCNFCCVCRRINNKSQDTMIACSLTPLLLVSRAKTTALRGSNTDSDTDLLKLPVNATGFLGVISIELHPTKSSPLLLNWGEFAYKASFSASKTEDMPAITPVAAVFFKKLLLLIMFLFFW